MITKAEVLKMIKNVRRRSRGLPDRRLIHPQRDWGVLLLVLLIGATGSVLYSGFTYLQYNSLNDTIEAESSQVARYDANAVAKALELYAAKSAAFTTLTEVPEVVLPEEPATTTDGGVEAEEAVVAAPREAEGTDVTPAEPEEEAALAPEAPELSF